MSRKNPFASLDILSISSESSPIAKPGYGMTGAAKTVVRSIEEMAENTKKLMDGETIIELDPNNLDSSIVSDRLSANDREYEELKIAIGEQGQTTPILVRPHPTDGNRYMIVFGHRRAQVAKDLGIKVKTVVKKLDDITSAIAQGQENSARSNLSFIERAYFAQNMISMGMGKDIVKSSIGIDDAMLSKMITVMETVPEDIIKALGAAKKIGRDKWLSLRQIVLNPAHLKVAQDHILTAGFNEVSIENRFDTLHEFLKRYKTKSMAKTLKTATLSKSWTSNDNTVKFTMNQKTKKVTMEFSSVEALPFSNWLSSNLEVFFDQYKQSKKETTGE